MKLAIALLNLLQSHVIAFFFTIKGGEVEIKKIFPKKSRTFQKIGPVVFSLLTGSPMRCCVVIIRNMYIITKRLATSEWIFIRTRYIHKLKHKNR